MQVVFFMQKFKHHLKLYNWQDTAQHLYRYTLGNCSYHADSTGSIDFNKIAKIKIRHNVLIKLFLKESLHVMHIKAYQKVHYHIKPSPHVPQDKAPEFSRFVKHTVMYFGNNHPFPYTYIYDNVYILIIVSTIFDNISMFHTCSFDRDKDNATLLFTL